MDAQDTTTRELPSRFATGAPTGFGRAMARSLAAGHSVWAGIRPTEDLERWGCRPHARLLLVDAASRGSQPAEVSRACGRPLRGYLVAQADLVDVPSRERATPAKFLSSPAGRMACPRRQASEHTAWARGSEHRRSLTTLLQLTKIELKSFTASLRMFDASAASPNRVARLAHGLLRGRLILRINVPAGLDSRLLLRFLASPFPRLFLHQRRQLDNASARARVARGS